MAHTRKLYYKDVNSTASTYVGEPGSVFYDPTTTQLRFGDGSTPGGNFAGASAASPITTSQTLSASSLGLTLAVNSGSATTVTIPAGLPTGFSCAIVQMGAGQVTVAAGAGVTLNNASSQFKTSGQYATVGILNVGTDSYVLSGSTSA
jgi:hypothetical protein